MMDLFERVAKAKAKKECQSQYGWSDEEFEVYWNDYAYFVTNVTRWGDGFQGTRKERAIYEARETIEAIFTPQFSKALRTVVHNALVDGPRLESDLESDFNGLVDLITDRVEALFKGETNG